MPIAATSQRLAAVVRPRIVNPWRKMTPAPRKPMPVTICAATRDGSKLTTLPPWPKKPANPYAPTSVKSAAPAETSMCVRSPAAFSSSSRSRPMTAPRSAATASRRSVSSQPIETSVTRRLDRAPLLHGDALDTGRRELEQLVQLPAAERLALGRRLHLDETAVAGHDDVQVDVGGRVLCVVEVEEGFAADDADRDGGDGVAQGPAEPEAVERAPGGDVGARDRRAARAAVRLEHVAVEPQRALAERLEVAGGAQGAADEPLDLDRPPLLSARACLAGGALARRGWKQRVLGRHPADAATGEPARHAVLDRGGAEDDRLPLPPQRAAVRLLQEVRLNVERSQLSGPPAIRAAHRLPASAPCNRLLLGLVRGAPALGPARSPAELRACGGEARLMRPAPGRRSQPARRRRSGAGGSALP